MRRLLLLHVHISIHLLRLCLNKCFEAHNDKFLIHETDGENRKEEIAAIHTVFQSPSHRWRLSSYVIKNYLTFECYRKKYVVIVDPEKADRREWIFIYCLDGARVWLRVYRVGIECAVACGVENLLAIRSPAACDERVYVFKVVDLLEVIVLLVYVLVEDEFATPCCHNENVSIWHGHPFDRGYCVFWLMVLTVRLKVHHVLLVVV